MKTEEQKPMVFCGVINMDGTPAKMTDSCGKYQLFQTLKTN